MLRVIPFKKIYFYLHYSSIQSYGTRTFFLIGKIARVEPGVEPGGGWASLKPLILLFEILNSETILCNIYSSFILYKLKFECRPTKLRQVRTTHIYSHFIFECTFNRRATVIHLSNWSINRNEHTQLLNYVGMKIEQRHIGSKAVRARLPQAFHHFNKSA